MEHGADGILVSNHGARYLEHTPSTIEVLPEIVDAVAGRIAILIDGGFRRGSDIFKALALGADAVSLGRPPLWGLGAFAAAGTQRGAGNVASRAGSGHGRRRLCANQRHRSQHGDGRFSIDPCAPSWRAPVACRVELWRPLKKPNDPHPPASHQTSSGCYSPPLHCCPDKTRSGPEAGPSAGPHPARR